MSAPDWLREPAGAAGAGKPSASRVVGTYCVFVISMLAMAAAGARQWATVEALATILATIAVGALLTNKAPSIAAAARGPAGPGRNT